VRLVFTSRGWKDYVWW